MRERIQDGTGTIRTTNLLQPPWQGLQNDPPLTKGYYADDHGGGGLQGVGEEPEAQSPQGDGAPVLADTKENYDSKPRGLRCA